MAVAPTTHARVGVALVASLTLLLTLMVGLAGANNPSKRGEGPPASTSDSDSDSDSSDSSSKSPPGSTITSTTVARPTGSTSSTTSPSTTVAGPTGSTKPTTTTSTTTTTLAPASKHLKPLPTTNIVQPCLGWSCETEPLKLGNTIGKLYGDGSAVVLFLSLRSSDEMLDFCGDEFASKSETVVFDVWGLGAEKIVEITILGIGEDEELDGDGYEVCFGGEEPFEQEGGSDAVAGDGLWFGLLPACADEGGTGWPGPEFAYWDGDAALNGTNYGPAPCVAWRALDDETGDLTVIVLAPPGDPRIKIG